MKKINSIKVGFSLMESMIVLLIVAIITACAAPILSKKMMRDEATRSPWLWLNNRGSIVYNPTGENNQTASIGVDANTLNLDPMPRLAIASSGTIPQISLARDNASGGTDMFSILYNNSSILVYPGVTVSNNIPSNSVIFTTEAIENFSNCNNSVIMGPNSTQLLDDDNSNSVILSRNFKVGDKILVRTVDDYLSTDNSTGLKKYRDSWDIRFSSYNKNPGAWFNKDNIYGVDVAIQDKAILLKNNNLAHFQYATSNDNEEFGETNTELSDLTRYFNNTGIRMCDDYLSIGADNKPGRNHSTSIGYRTAHVHNYARRVDPNWADKIRSVSIGAFAGCGSDPGVTGERDTYGGLNNVVIGHKANVKFNFTDTSHPNSCVVIGNEALAGNVPGKTTKATSFRIGAEIAVGSKAIAGEMLPNGTGFTTVSNTVALGSNTKANECYAVVIGGNDKTSILVDLAIVCGRLNYIATYDSDSEKNNKIIQHNPSNNGMWDIGTVNHSVYLNNKVNISNKFIMIDGKKEINIKDKVMPNSDIRLKNIIGDSKGGLADIRKLEVFNYTFKDDKKKTPHVGVIAQDLMKIFPDAVWKGDDGFYRIRMEDMFYALINAIKELDNKITEIANSLNEIKTKSDSIEKDIQTAKTNIDILISQNADIDKRLSKLEKKKK